MNKRELAKKILTIEMEEKLLNDSDFLKEFLPEKKEEIVKEFIDEIYGKINFNKSVLADEINNIIYIYSIYNFQKFDSEEQKEVIREGFSEGLSIADIDIYAKRNISAQMMETVKNALLRGINKDFISKLLDKGISLEKLKLAIDDYLDGMDIKIIDIYIDNSLSDETSKEIRLALLNGIPQANVKNYLFRVEFDHDQIREMRLWLEMPFNEKYFDEYFKAEYSADKIKELRKLSKYQFKKSNDPKDTQTYRYIMDNNLQSNQIRLLREALYESDIPIEFSDVKNFIGNRINFKVSEVFIDLLSKGYNANELYKEFDSMLTEEEAIKKATKIKIEKFNRR